MGYMYMPDKTAEAIDDDGTYVCICVHVRVYVCKYVSMYVHTRRSCYDYGWLHRVASYLVTVLNCRILTLTHTPSPTHEATRYLTLTFVLTLKFILSFGCYTHTCSFINSNPKPTTRQHSGPISIRSITVTTITH